MRLSRLFPGIPQDGGNLEITSLAYDTRSVQPGTLFFCVPGFTRDGHDFAPDAIARGAVALVVERPLGPGRPGGRWCRASGRRWRRPPRAFYGDPTASLQTVGVTGTNGKTTTAFLVRALLEADGRQTGLLGTVKSVIGGDERAVERTTPEAIDLQRTLPGDARRGRPGVRDGGLLARARAPPGRRDPLRGGDLHQPDPGPSRLPRHDGGVLRGQAAAVRAGPGPPVRWSTSTTRTARGWPPSCADAVDVRDRPRGHVPRERLSRRTSSGSQLHASHGPDGVTQLSSPLPGRFNVLQRARGARRRPRARRPDRRRGRRDRDRRPACRGALSRSTPGQEFAVLVDYAHTPDSLENVLQAARGLLATGPGAAGCTSCSVAAATATGASGR